MGFRSRLQSPATKTKLGTITQDRIHRLVLRVVQNAYGAESSLRSVVRLGALEMVAVGASHAAVRHAIAECVVSHPDSLPDRPSLITGESRAADLLRQMLAWTDELGVAPRPASG